MKVAICQIGHIRTWEHNCENQLKLLIDPYNSDVFVDTSIQNSKPVELKFWIEPKEKIEEIVNRTLGNRVKTFFIENEEVQKDLDRSTQWTRFSRCLQSLVNYEQQNNIKYDVVVKCRFDISIKQTIKIANLQENTIYCRGHHDGRLKINDQLFFGTRESMIKFIDFPNVYKWGFNSEKQVASFITETNKMSLLHGDYEFGLKR